MADEIPKMDLKSKDITEEQKQKLKQLFPEVVTEEKIDFDKLRQTLGEEVEDEKERYELSWAGKSQCIKVAQERTTATLKPCREESVNFDTTENLFIEGDNLEVLKLLQKSYSQDGGKIKMIYIDPPYNTGNDFVYNDKFGEELQNYLKLTGQTDEEGRKLTTNTEATGRYHSNWLNMMYPRLFLAKNLLREDGVIFISIDDNEVANLRRICDEIFGEENFEGLIHWRRRHNQPNDPTKMIGLVAEHILSYSKNKAVYKESGVGKLELTGNFSNPDNDPRGDWASKPWKVGSDQSGSRYKITTPTGKVLDEEWMGEEATFKSLLSDNRIIWPKNGDGAPRKKYFKFEREAEGQCATNWWPHERFGHNQGANDELTDLMGIKNVFSNPKPTSLIASLISISNVKDNDIILDFFAGSGTTFHAAIIHDSKIKCICVQLPEMLSEKDKDQRIGYEFCINNNLTPTIAEIGKERIRRVIRKINEEQKHNPKRLNQEEKSTQNLGVRVFKLDKSNFKVWDVSSEELTQSILSEHVETVEKSSSPEDLLYELILKDGLELTEKIEEKELAEKKVYSIMDTILICLEKELTLELVKEMAKLKPSRIICLDEGFKGNDQLKSNAAKIFSSLGEQVIFKTV